MQAGHKAALVAMLLVAAAPAARPVLLSQQPGSPLEATARRLAAGDLKDAAANGDTPLVLVGSAELATSRHRSTQSALFVQLQSASLCGSAGCSTSVYVGNRHGWHKVLDSISGPIKVDARSHLGMHDLLVRAHDRWIWNGTSYADTLPAPTVDLDDTTPRAKR